jgi:HSP20 family protein
MTPYGHEGWGDVFFDRLWPEWPRACADEWRPNVDLRENDGKYTLKAELPGVNKDDISVSYSDGYVTVSGKRESEKEEEGTSYHMKEVSHGSFSRSFRLPKKVDVDKVDAS